MGIVRTLCQNIPLNIDEVAMTQPHDTNKWKNLNENLKKEEEADTALEGLPPQEQKTPAEITQLENELDQAKLLAEKNRNDYLRVLAEMENLRRRLERDLEQAHKYALEKMVRELLPVVDSLEKSLEHANDETLKQGVEMTLNLLLTTLRKFQVTEINPIGQVFNPAHHEAMSAVPSAEHAPNTVIQVLQKGFMLHDRLVRPALVVVSKADK